MAAANSHRVGVIAESKTDIHALRNVVAEAGMLVSDAVEFNQWKPGEALNAEIDAWIVNLDVEKLEQVCPEKIDALIDAIPGMMILCEGGSPPAPAEGEYLSWKRRLLDKIRDISGTLNLNEQEAPSHVWVLIGSIGGPDAIRAFFESLPPDLGIAFIYANHLQPDFDGVLANATSKNSHYPAYTPRHGDVLKTNQVAIVSPEYTTSLKPNGTLQVSNTPWQGQYKPNLDHVVSGVAKTFGATGGVIIFSGMCDDGAASCRIMKQYGGKVWAQQPLCCISSAMPDAALATGYVEKMGTPEELAAFLTTWVNEQNMLAAGS